MYVCVEINLSVYVFRVAKINTADGVMSELCEKSFYIQSNSTSAQRSTVRLRVPTADNRK